MTGRPGVLSPGGCRVRHNLATEQQQQEQHIPQSVFSSGDQKQRPGSIGVPEDRF